jgi:DNA polymerase III delta prime subunit
MEKLWTEKWRPTTVAECVFPEALAKRFEEYVADGNVPNLLLVGKPGVGKTTVALALLNQIGADSLVINASLHGNIDTLRTDIVQFASSVSLFGGRKYVILDEADYLNPNSTQPALRNFIEEYSENCGFILTCNFPNRIIEPLRSRLAVVDFSVKKSDYPIMMAAFMKRACQVLDAERIGYDKKVVAHLVAKHFPDFRKVLNELQSHSYSGAIDPGILSVRSDISPLVRHLRDRNFTEVRKWVGENSDMDATSLMRELYDRSIEEMEPGDLAILTILIGKYQYQAAFVADQEINLVAFLAEVMRDCSFK